MVLRSFLERIKDGFRQRNPRQRVSGGRLSVQSVEKLEARQLLTINFNFQYQGTINANGFGFEDPILGAGRRAALADAAQQLGSQFENNATIAIDVVSTNDIFSGFLAQAGSELIRTAQTDPFGGNEVVRTKALTGIDLNGTAADGTLDVNWANVFEISSDPADVDPLTEFDFYSVITHELTHALGFTSQINENGSDTFGVLPGQLGTWSRYDSFLSDSVGDSVLDFNGVLKANVWNAGSTGGTSVTGGGLFFNGPTAVGLNNGQRIGLFTPDPWVDGSSVSHLDDTNPAYAGSLMLSATGPGPSARSYSAIEEAIMIDLGYTLAGSLIVTPQTGLTVSDLGNTATFDVSLGRQPVSNVVVTISSGDAGEVTAGPTSIVFTPANWDTAQTVTLTGVADGLPDGDQSTFVTVAIDDAASDDSFDPVNDIRLTVVSTDDDGTIPGKPAFTSPGQLPATPTPLFEWLPVANGRTYTVTVTNFFTGALVRQITDVTVPRYTFPTPFVNGVYQAIVQGTNAAGVSGPASDPLLFSIGTPAIPVAPVLTAPIQGSVTTLNTPTIEWNRVAGASEYELYISASGQVTRVVDPGTDIGNGVLSYLPTTPLLEGFNAVWIRAFNPFGDTGPWSSPLGFTVDAVPAPTRPVITSPLVTTTTTAFPTFAWVGSGAQTYELWVNELPGGASNVVAPTRVIYVTDFLDTEYTHFAPLNNGVHRVWVRGVNSAGEKSAWSTFEEFNVNVPQPERAVLTEIGTTEDQTPTFRWSSVSGELFASDSTFSLWVNNLTTGQPRVLLETELTGTSYTPTTPLPQGRYAAWVQTVSAVGVRSAWSERLVFTIDQPAPGQPTFTGPVAASGSAADEILTDKPQFTWTAAQDAATYELWVNHRESNTVRIVHELGLTSTSYTPALGLPEGNYTAWVRAYNAAGEVGEWSSAFSFLLNVPTPTIPVITGPAPNPVGSVTDPSPTISWTVSVPAASYDLQVERVSTGQVIIDQTGITSASYTVPFKLDETTYRARVRGVNSAGETGGWSEYSQFRIDVPNATTPIAEAPSGTVTQNQVTFQWQHTPGNVRYEILVRDLLNQEQIILQRTTNQLDLSQNSAVTTENLTNGTYRFWVRAFNSQNTASSWSNSLSFTVDNTLTSLDPSQADDPQVVPILTSLKTARNKTEPLPPPHEDVAAAPAESDGASVTAQTPTEGVPDTAALQGMAGRRQTDFEQAIEAVMAEFADPSEVMSTHVE